MRAIAAMWIAGVVLCSFGCGGGSAGQSSPEPEPSSGTTRMSPPKIIGRKPVFAKGRSACRSAGVRVGPRRGEIIFEAHCAGTAKGGDLELAVLRRPYPRSAHEAPIVRASPGFSVRGAGKIVGPSGCRMKGGEIRCGASLRGRAVLAGRFWVYPGSRCGFDVSVVTITAPACPEPNCDGVFRVAEIHSGRPKGCAGQG